MFLSLEAGKTFSKHLVYLNCPNQSPPDCGAKGLANGRAIVMTQRALGPAKLGVKTLHYQEKECLHKV